MLGWYFCILRSAEASPGLTANNSLQLASWEAGLGGTKWIDDLVSSGTATDLGGNGYPNRYSAQANDLVAALRALVAHQSRSIDLAKLEALDPSEVLLVEAWDQS
jgi:hypothetical protein